MAKVYEFPVKTLPEEMEKYLYELGKDVGAALYYALDIFGDKYNLDFSQKELMELIMDTYARGTVDSMEEL